MSRSITAWMSPGYVLFSFSVVMIAGAWSTTAVAPADDGSGCTDLSLGCLEEAVVELRQQVVEVLRLRGGEQRPHIRIGGVGHGLPLGQPLRPDGGEVDAYDAPVSGVPGAGEEPTGLQAVQVVADGGRADVHALGQLPRGHLGLLRQDPQEDPLLQRSSALGEAVVEPLAGELHGQEELAGEAIDPRSLEIEGFREATLAVKICR